MRRSLRPAVLLGGLALALLPAAPASAHPLGNFTVNTADRLLVTQDGVEVTHLVDLAEIPTVQLAQARAAVRSAQVQVDQAQQTLAATTLSAPSAGTVLAVNGVVGQTVSGGGTSSASSSGTARWRAP